jgi:hypothetical protein
MEDDRQHFYMIPLHRHLDIVQYLVEKYPDLE